MEKIKPIRTEADYKVALAIVDKYFDAQAGTPEGDLMEVLSVLIEDYERKHFPVSLPDPIEAILYHLESRGLDRKYLERFIGSRGRVSEILNKKRPLSMEMIRSLHEGLGIPLEILLQKYMDEPELPVPVAQVKDVGNFSTLGTLVNQGAEWLFTPTPPISSFPDKRKPLQANSYKHKRFVRRTTCAHFAQENP